MPDSHHDRPSISNRRSILFICTGNTCRSPLAEVLCKRLLADYLKVDVTELPALGFEVRSAGVMATAGDSASPEADEVSKEYNVSLAEHRSQPVNSELLECATDVIAMTTAHALLLNARFPNYGPKPVLLCRSADLPDPIGGDRNVYRACAAIIREELDRHIKGWLGI